MSSRVPRRYGASARGAALWRRRGRLRRPRARHRRAPPVTRRPPTPRPSSTCPMAVSPGQGRRADPVNCRSRHDLQEVYYLASDLDGVPWICAIGRVRPAATVEDFIGGAAIVAQVSGEGTCAATTYGALTGGVTTSGEITLPLAGDYDVVHGTGCWCNTADFVLMSYSVGAVAANDVSATALHRRRSLTPPSFGFTAVASTPGGDHRRLPNRRWLDWWLSPSSSGSAASEGGLMLVHQSWLRRG